MIDPEDGPAGAHPRGCTIPEHQMTFELGQDVRNIPQLGNVVSMDGERWMLVGLVNRRGAYWGTFHRLAEDRP